MCVLLLLCVYVLLCVLVCIECVCNPNPECVDLLFKFPQEKSSNVILANNFITKINISHVIITCMQI